MYGKGFLGNMPENMQADFVQSRQAGFVRCCLNENCSHFFSITGRYSHFMKIFRKF